MPILFIGLWVAAFVYWIVAIVEVAKIPDAQFRATGSEKIVWLLIVILGGIIGALVWRFAKRDDVSATGRGAAASPWLVPRGRSPERCAGGTESDGLMCVISRRQPPSRRA